MIYEVLATNGLMKWIRMVNDVYAVDEKYEKEFLLKHPKAKKKIRDKSF